MKTTQHNQRTDPHRPGLMVSEEYVMVSVWEWTQVTSGQFYPDGTPIMVQKKVEYVERPDLADAPRFQAEKHDPSEHRCDHCGSHNIHKQGIYLYHKPTGERIHVGVDCYERRFNRLDWKLITASAECHSFFKLGAERLAEAGYGELVERFNSRCSLDPQRWRKNEASSYDEAEFHLERDWRRMRTQRKSSVHDMIQLLFQLGEKSQGQPHVAPHGLTHDEDEQWRRAIYERGVNRREFLYRQMFRAADRVAGADASAYGAIRAIGKDDGNTPENHQRFVRAMARFEEGLEKVRETWAEFLHPEEKQVGEAPSGKATVEGKILTTKWQDGYYGGGTIKMLCELPNGAKVWGSLPSVNGNDPEKGDTIRFTATFERKAGDNSFAFFKRPTKAELVRA